MFFVVSTFVTAFSSEQTSLDVHVEPAPVGAANRTLASLAHEPSGMQAPDAHSAFTLHARHAFASQTGFAPVHATLFVALHWTHLPSSIRHAGVIALQ